MRNTTITITKARDLRIGDVILDGIPSRIDSVVYHDDLDEAYIMLTDGNGYRNALRLSGEVNAARYDWTEGEWKAYLES